MSSVLLPTLLFVLLATLLAGGMLAVGMLLGPRRNTAVKQMPYESGMDPIHDARRRFDVRFYLVAIAFLVFDVELLFLYPWAVANKHPAGLSSVATPAGSISVNLIFVEVLVFVGLLALGFVYAWRKGVFRWR
ncbi:MAG: NADH-quinone oxidoreductase subunit A [Pirellulaceae bacterium]